LTLTRFSFGPLAVLWVVTTAQAETMSLSPECPELGHWEARMEMVGTVDVKLHVDSSGDVTGLMIMVKSEHPRGDANVIDVLRQCKFKPTGKPSIVSIRYHYANYGENSFEVLKKRTKQ